MSSLTGTPATPPPSNHRPLLPRSPSDPGHIQRQTISPPQQIYVLSADGSSLFLLDPTKPKRHEEPPPYASYLDRTVPFPRSRDDDRRGQSGLLRHRASTMSALDSPQTVGAGPSRLRPRYHSSLSTNSVGSLNLRPRHDRTRSALSSPGAHTTALIDERTPLLTTGTASPAEGELVRKKRGVWRSIFCGELEVDDERRGLAAGVRRFWSPVVQGNYWKAMAHLCFLNFPFALLAWSPLVAGTLAGTALLITLPLGAMIWWLTLFISRSAARLEVIMQVHHHSPLNPTASTPTYHPIFHRVKERSAPPSPISDLAEVQDIQWEKRFITCSYAMFGDHYSYSSLSYFILIKPAVVLFSTILLIVLFPVSVALIAGLPVYLRAARRWGKWQAGVAVGNL